MKQIYTNENRLLAMNSKNVLESAGIAVEIKNEHTSGSAIPGQSNLARTLGKRRRLQSSDGIVKFVKQRKIHELGVRQMWRRQS